MAHPEQIIDFDLQVPVEAKNSYLIGPNEQEVPYQLLEGGKKLAVRTGLPACRYPVPVEWTWTLYTGRAPARVTDGVVVTRTPTACEISNGLTGVRVPQSPATRDGTLAPVQGIRLRDGTRTATGPNHLSMNIVHEYPSAGPVFTLQPGLNKLSFTGAQFGTKDKPALGIDFDLVTVSDEARQAHIGNWADNWVGGLWNTFQQVNGRPYEERQHILRIRGAGPFTTFILPWRKGQQRETTASREGALLLVKAGDERYTIGDGYYGFAQGAKHGLTLFSVQEAAGEGITAAGGPVEVLLDAHSVTITVSGTPGTRTITLPGVWRAKDPDAPAKLANGTWQIDYTGSDPLTVTLTSAT